jgi:hypothetical protein
MDSFPQFEWTKFYNDIEKAIPMDMPEPLGKDANVCMMCDSDHAGDKRTRCSCTGFLIFEFVAMKHRIEKLQGLQYKLCMMGFPLTGISFIYADNKSQVTNSTRLESTLKKKCNSICYHKVQESIAMGESLITHIKTGENLSDFMTKVTCSSKHHQLVGNILYDIYDDHPKQKGKTS